LIFCIATYYVTNYIASKEKARRCKKAREMLIGSGLEAVSVEAMQTRASTIFCRATKRRPCLICGKPDWCVYVRDESLSVCMRVADGALISGAKGLLERGLDRDSFDRYGGLPASWKEREILCRQILQEIGERHHIADSPRGVPGFWKDANGYHLWKEIDYHAPRLLIPVLLQINFLPQSVVA
jgi:hypothetical protein